MFEVLDSRLIHVFPRDAKRDRTDLLNVGVHDLKLTARYDILLQYPEYIIPELQTEVARRSKTGGFAGSMLGNPNAQQVTVATLSGTVRDVLNAVAEKTEDLPGTTPSGWIYTFQIDSALPMGGRPHWGLF